MPRDDGPRDLVLVGGGALAREIHDWFAPGLAAQGRRFVGYLDDGEAPLRARGRDLPQLGRLADHRPDPARGLVMAIGAPAGKRAVAERLVAAGGRFAALLHPSAWIAASARIGEGVVASVFAHVSADAVLEDFAMLNGHASVGHDVRLGAFSTLSGHVDLTGAVRIGEGCFLGSGARVLPGLTLGAGCTVGAGAVVMRDAPAGSTLYAAPARRL